MTFEIFTLLISILFLNGCWDNQDIDKRVIPLVMGISIGDDGGYKVSLQIPTTKKEATQARVVTENGKTVPEVLDHIQMNSEDVVDYSRLGLLIIDDTVAKEKQVGEYIEIFNKVT